MKSNMKIKEKTVEELFYKTQGASTSLTYESRNLSFTGIRSKELKEALHKLCLEREDVYKKDWQKYQSEKIESLKNELLLVVDGWFSKPSIEIKKRLAKEQAKVCSVMPESYEYDIYVKFLLKYSVVKIGEGNSSVLY